MTACFSEENFQNSLQTSSSLWNTEPLPLLQLFRDSCIWRKALLQYFTSSIHRGGENQLNNFLPIGNEVMHVAVSAINNAIIQPSSISSSHLVHMSDNMYGIWS